MLPYAIFILLALLLAIFFDRQEEYVGTKKLWYRILCLYLILLAGFRNGVGGDTQGYMEQFQYIPSNPAEYGSYIMDQLVYASHMPGWTIITLLAKRWFDSFYAVQLIEAAIVNTCLFYFFRKNTTHIFLCALLFGLTGQFFNMNTEVMREGIAVGLCCVGMHQYLQGNKKWFYILAASSLFFHISAAVVFIFPFVRLKHISIKTLVAALLISFALWFGSDILIEQLTHRLRGESGLVAKIMTYSDQASTIFGFLSSALKYLVVTAGALYFAQEGKEDDTDWQQRYVRYMSFYLLLAILGCGLSGFSRFLNYTVPFMLVMMAEFMGNYTRYLRYLAISKTVILAGIFGLMGMFYMHYLPQTGRHFYDFFVPYTSVMDEHVDNTYREEMYLEATAVQDANAKNSRNF